MRNLFIDISDMVVYARDNKTVSGIQRVIFNVSKSICAQNSDLNVYFSFYEGSSGEYKCCPARFILEMEQFSSRSLLKILGLKAGKSDPLYGALSRYHENPLKLGYHRNRIAMAARRGDERRLLKYGLTLEDWRQLNEIDEELPGYKPELVSRVSSQGDIVLMMDANWSSIQSLDAVESLKDSGVVPVVMVHDLICLMRPEFFQSHVSATIFHWLKKTTTYCANYLTVSRSTKNDVDVVFKEIGHTATVTAVPLANDATNQAGLPATVEARLRQHVGISRAVAKVVKTPYVLVVGTQEIRKNNWGLAQAWQQLAGDPEVKLPKLVFAGKPGWMNDDFCDWMAASGNLGGWVEILNNPSEQELDFLYRNCEFTAYPSFYEGWGLPVGESLSYGKTAVVADNSSLPEVGGNLVEYCQAEDVGSIARAAKKLICDTEYRKRLEDEISKTKMRSWDDVATDIISAIKGASV